MLQYAIYDEKEQVIGEFETLEEGRQALEALGDGEIHPYAHGEEGYYTAHYTLERGYCSRICAASAELQLKDGAPPDPVCAADLGLLLAFLPCEEQKELLVTLDPARARRFFEELTPPPIVWNAAQRTLTVDYYFMESEDTPDGDVGLSFKCAPFGGRIYYQSQQPRFDGAGKLVGYTPCGWESYENTPAPITLEEFIATHPRVLPRGNAGNLKLTRYDGDHNLLEERMLWQDETAAKRDR